MNKYLHLILVICVVFLSIRLIIVKNQIPEPELIKKETEYNNNFTYEECENWCSEMKFRGQEYVICLTGYNMKKNEE